MIRHRRNNLAAGLVILTGAIIITFAPALPMVTFKTMSIGLNIGVVDLDLNYEHEIVPPAILALFFTFGIIMIIAAILLIATRVRGLGILWRVGTLLSFTITAMLIVYVWDVVGGDPLGLLNSTGTTQTSGSVDIDAVTATLEEILKGAGIISMTPAIGLYLATLGAAMILIGCCIPSIKRSEIVHVQRTEAALSQPRPQDAHLNIPIQFQETPADWYHVDGGYRYWDGKYWTDEFSPDA